MQRSKTGWIIFGIVIIVLLFIMFSLAGKYNTLVTANENINGKWSQVENNLQRRADLIPNLVETVKGYAAQEKEVFTAIADARSKLLGANNVAETSQANNELSSALGRLLAISEAYPTLKSDQNFRALQDELAGTENRIAVARKDYNDAVQSYNTMIKTFPARLMASIFGFAQKDYFQAEESATGVPKVQF